MKEKKPCHRPKRRFPNARRQVCKLELKVCPHCGSRLKSTHTLYIDKEIQTLQGPVNVRAYGYQCSNPACPHPEVRYRPVKEVLHTSLPFGTYGLDVISFVGWQRDQKHRQFAEIQRMLEEQGVEISERHVGRLYRQYLALLAGMNDELAVRLKETEREYGGVIWAMDGLQPDQNGPQMYVLYEVLSGNPVAAAWFDKRDTPHLQAWLKPYGQLELKVLATLSDGEEAEMAAMQAVWPEAPHQMCQVHFLSDIAQPIREGDKRLRAVLVESFGKLPAIPGNEETAQAGPKARTLELSLPSGRSGAGSLVEEEQGERVIQSDSDDDQDGKTGSSADGSQNRSDETLSKQKPVEAANESSALLEIAVRPAIQAETTVRLNGLEFQFRAAFQDALHRPSRKPSTFGGLAGYDQLQTLVTTLQFHLPKGYTGYLQVLLGQGQQALQEAAELAEDVRRAQSYLQQVTHLLAASLESEQTASQPRDSNNCSAEQGLSRGQQVKQVLETTLTTLANHPHNGLVTQSFLANTVRLLTKWEDNLFHCYDIPGLPASNTDLEARFSDLRRGERRVSGRKETSALQRTGHFQVLLRASTMAELWERLCEVPVAAYRAARERLEVAEERHRWLYRLHRWPSRTVMAMLEEYLGLQHQLSSMKSAAP